MLQCVALRCNERRKTSPLATTPGLFRQTSLMLDVHVVRTYILRELASAFMLRAHAILGRHAVNKLTYMLR